MLGVLGGGQLGRMWSHAAQALGFRTAVLDPDVHSPAGLVSHLHVCADYLDPGALAQMAAQCQAITTEFENVPAQALRQLGLKILKMKSRWIYSGNQGVKASVDGRDPDIEVAGTDHLVESGPLRSENFEDPDYGAVDHHTESAPLQSNLDRFTPR